MQFLLYDNGSPLKAATNSFTVWVSEVNLAPVLTVPADRVMSEGGDSVRHLGHLDHHDPHLASAFSACSVFVLPSTLETPGLAALEAAASGAAVVVTSEGSTRDYFADHVHYANHADPADIRRAIEAALARGPDPALKTHVLKQFGWNTVTAALPGVYKQAIRRNPRATRAI